MTRSTPILAAMFVLVYHARALIAADLAAWAAFTFMDYWPGQVLAFVMLGALLAFQVGLRLGQADGGEMV